MSDDMKALRALVEVSRGDGGRGSLARCVLCQMRDDHDADCPVPAAEAALARLEAREVAESGRTRYDLGEARYAEAREQAARLLEEAAAEVRAVHRGWWMTLSALAAEVRTMEPEG